MFYDDNIIIGQPGLRHVIVFKDVESFKVSAVSVVTALQVWTFHIFIL